MTETINTATRTFSKAKFAALIKVRSVALRALRDALLKKGYDEVTTSSLVNVAGSCENPNASFTLNYYGKEAHLSQSAQLQLEALVLRLKKGFFTVTSSFREEDYEDPDAPGRRLSEFTLVEPEKPYPDCTAEDALRQIIQEEEDVIKSAVNVILEECKDEVILLGGDVDYLTKVANTQFNIITYDEALKIVGKKFGDDFGVADEKKILKQFNKIPTFVTNFPTVIKFFNMKRHPDGKRVFSVDLLMPELGETVGGAVREEDGEKIKDFLRNSKVGEYLQEKNINPEVPFTEYFNLFDDENPLLRGGFGIGFERFVGFLISSNDILATIAHRSMHPR
jgi:asparaginyl-tRNA synthetase